MACDQYFADVGLLIHCDGANGSTSFVDSSSNALSIANTGNHVVVDTSAPKFGSGAANFGVAAGDHELVATVTPNGPLDMGTGAFTVEFWMKWNGAPVGGSVCGDNIGGLFTWICIVTDINPGTSALGFQVQTLAGATEVGTPATTFVTGTWYAIALQYTGGVNGTLTAFLNGVAGTPQNAMGTMIATKGQITIGATTLSVSSDGMELDDIRITKGVARYPGNYTPAGPFPNIPCGGSYSTPVLSGSIPNPTLNPLRGVLTWTESDLSGTPATGYDIYRNGVSIATVGQVLTYTDNVPSSGNYTYNVAAFVGGIDVSPLSNTITLDYSASFVLGFTNTIFDEVIFGAYFGGQLNLVEFTYMPGRTPFEEGATNLIINRYKQEPTDVRQRGVDFTQFVVPGELLQTVAVTGISAQGVLQASTDPLVTPLVVTNVVIDPVTQLKFGYSVSGGQNGIEYTVQFTTTTNIQTETLEEIFSINILVEDSFP